MSIASGNRARIAVVSQDDRVVKSVGKPGQDGELESGQVEDRIGSFRGTVEVKKEKQETEKDPACDIERDGLDLSLLESGTKERHRASM